MAPTSLRRDVSVGSKATGAAMTEALPVFPEQQTSSEPVGMSQTCHSTKSLRSSPLRGGKSRESGSQLTGKRWRV
jgi:hypothetical protein